jgi:Zn-dependent protease
VDSTIGAVVWYLAFVFSVTLHEAGHAWAAQLGGDPTAYEGGQVSLDPVPHIRREPFGMVVLPLLSLWMMGWPLGFASAPYDPLWADQHPRRAAWMSLAGPAANLLILLACAAFIWTGIAMGGLEPPNQAFFTQVVASVAGGVWQSAAFVVSVVFSLNLILLIFNLIPLPPLDGAGAIGLLLSESQARSFRAFRSNPTLAIVGMLIAWYTFGAIFGPIFRVSLNLLYPGAGYQ